MNQTSTSRRSARWRALPLAALFTTVLLAAATSGCISGGAFCDHPLVDKPVVTCNGGGSVNATVTNGLALPGTAPLVEGLSCLATDGTCSQRPTLDFQSDRTAAGNQFQLGVQLAPGDGPGTYALPDTRAVGINVFGSVSLGAKVATLQPVAGTIVVTRSDANNLTVSFDIEVETADGQEHIALSTGQIDLDGCQVMTAPTCVDDKAGD